MVEGRRFALNSRATCIRLAGFGKVSDGATVWQRRVDAFERGGAGKKKETGEKMRRGKKGRKVGRKIDVT